MQGLLKCEMFFLFQTCNYQIVFENLIQLCILPSDLQIFWSFFFFLLLNGFLSLCLLEFVAAHYFRATYIDVINAHNPSKIFTSGFFFNRFCFNWNHLLSLTLKLLSVREIWHLLFSPFGFSTKTSRWASLQAGTADQRRMSSGWELVKAPASTAWDTLSIQSGLGDGRHLC